MDTFELFILNIKSVNISAENTLEVFLQLGAIQSGAGINPL